MGHVRFGFAADSSQVNSGLCPSSSDLLSRIKGIAQNLKGMSTAGHSHRLTSGGEAETAPTEAFAYDPTLPRNGTDLIATVMRLSGTTRRYRVTVLTSLPQ